MSAGATVPGLRWPRRPLAPRREADHDALIAAHMATLAAGTHTVAVLGAKGGVGTTAVTLLAGLLLAEAPGARPVIVELTPDGGVMASLLHAPNGRTAIDLLVHLTAAHRDGVRLVQGFLTLWGRLPVLPAPSLPVGVSPLTPEDYAAILSLLGRHYNLVLLDCGATITHPLVQYASRVADHVLIVGNSDPVAVRRMYALVTHLAGDAGNHSATALTVLVNGADVPLSPLFSGPHWRQLIPCLNATMALPFSEPLRRRFASGTLAVETVPTDVRRALKCLIPSVLGRLAYP